MAEAGGDASVAAAGALPCDSQDEIEIGSSSELAAESDQLQPPPALNHMELFKAIEVVERDSRAIAECFTSLSTSLRLAIAEVSGSSVEHMQCFSDAAGRLQESALDAPTEGNRYINSRLRLNKEMKGADNLAAQIKYSRKTVDALDSAVNRLLRLP